MNYIDFKAGNKTYKLRLTTKHTVLLERQIGCNPIHIFGTDTSKPQVPTITAMVAILHASLQQYNHGISLDDAYDIFEDYLIDGNTITDFVPVIVEIYQNAGIMPKPKDKEKMVLEEPVKNV